MESEEKFRKNGIGKCALLSIIILVAGIMCFNAFCQELYFAAYPLMVLFFFSTTAIAISVMAKAWKKDNLTFYNKYLLTHGIKFLLIIFICLIYCWKIQVNSKSFVVCILLFHAIYSTFEIKFLNKLNSFQNETNTESKK